MRTLFIIFLFLFTSGLSSQVPEWIRGRDFNYEMNPEMLNYSVTVSPEGNIWYAGIKNYIQVYNDAMGDLFLALYNSNGDLIQDYEALGSILLRDIKTDPEGFVYITGQIRSDISFWDGFNIYFTGPFINGFIACISPQGTVAWGINLNQLFPNASPEEIFIHEGNIYLVHYSWSSSNITKFDPDGNVISNIVQSASIASGMAIDSDGYMFVTGSCPDSQSLFGGVAFPSPFSYSIYLVKYNPQGIPEWVKFIEDITCPKPKVAIGNNDRIFLTANLQSDNQLTTQAFNSPEWIFDIYLTSLNTDGEVIWNFAVPELLPGDARLAINNPILIMEDNSVTLTGSTRGIIDWGNGVISGKEGFDSDVLALNISADGQAMWAVTGGGPGHDVSNAIARDADGNLMIAGVGHGTIQFDTCTYTGNSFYFPFLVKLNAGLNTGVDSDNLPVRFIAYPNPANDFLIIESASENNISAILLNLNGQEIMRHTFHNQDAKLDVRSLLPGIYVLKMISNDSVESQKIIIR